MGWAGRARHRRPASPPGDRAKLDRRGRGRGWGAPRGRASLTHYPEHPPPRPSPPRGEGEEGAAALIKDRHQSPPGVPHAPPHPPPLSLPPFRTGLSSPVPFPIHPLPPQPNHRRRRPPSPPTPAP